MPDSFDCIVVGAGGAGLAAAYSAACQGATVALLECRPQPGGTTGIAVGSFTAAGTRWQQREGIEDNPADHDEDVALFADPLLEARNNQPLRRFFLEHAAETLHWLQEELQLNYVGPSPEPPNRCPRMHNVVPGAKAYVVRFQLALRRRGATIITDAAVTRLLQENGRIHGVEFSRGGKQCQLRARRGVVLATGDYASNAEMIARHKGEEYREIEGINPHALGLGHQLAEQVGARLVNMDITYGPELRLVPRSGKPFQQWLPASGIASRCMGWLAERMPAWMINRFIKRLLVTWQHPEDALFRDGAILVNARGRRFVNELSWPEREIAVARQPEKTAYLLLDGRLAEQYSSWPNFISTAPDIAYAYVDDYLRLRPDVTLRGRQLEPLCRRRGLDSRVLQATLEEFNRHARDGTVDSLGRPGATSPLEAPPWLLLGPVKAYFTTTEGGAAINQRLQVLDQQGQPIPGLFAAGQVGLGGMVLWSHGLHIAWAMTSGRLAGIEVAAES
jgi:succinate dehydrogenase/fumarate reductase flavoprotein subunit